jgi:LCP family protein required for cell wall assembly
MLVRSVVWFVVLLVVLGAAFLLWRHFNPHEKLSSVGISVATHSTAAALGVFVAVLIGSMLFTGTRATAQALALLAIVVLGAGAVGGFYVYGIHVLDSFRPTTPAGHKLADSDLLTQLGSTKDPAVALIAGYDHRAGMGTKSYARSNSDTLILVRADPTNDTVSLLSFPRDLNVPIYCKGNTVSYHERVNAAWALCGANGGPEAAVDTIQHLTGLKVKVNFLITLDFHAFQEIVHEVHGVYVNIDRRYYNKNVGTYDTNYANIDLHPGYQKLNGAQALEFVRFRHLDSDIYRNGRQQLFLEALKQRLKSELTVSNFQKILGALSDNLEFVSKGGAPPTPEEVNAYVGLLLGLPPGHLIRNSIPAQDLQNYVTPEGADELIASQEVIDATVNRFLHPNVPVVHTHKPGGKKTPELPHKDVSVLVLNGGNIDGEAAHTSSALHKQGFAVKHMSSGEANAPSKTLATIVYYDSSQPTGRAAAKELAVLFGSHTRVTQITPAIASYAQKAGNPLTVVAIGTKYKGSLKLPHSGPKQPSTATAQVQPGVPVTLSAIRSENGPAHFTLMLPHKVANGSTISTQEGVRLFHPLPGKQELVLTFNLYGGVEYWQVEESNWTTEPLLQHPTSKFNHHGRTYLEFTSGGQIQQIAVRYGKNIYWVQNTILNSLSNSTMIAIAEGLRPFH